MTFTFLPLFSLPYNALQPAGALAGIAAALCPALSVGKALPKLKDPDRLPDPTTVQRWARDLDCSELAVSFISQIVTRVAHWLERGRQALDGSGAFVLDPLRLCKISVLCVFENSLYPPSLPGLPHRRPTLGSGGEKGTVGEDVEALKRRLSLLDYLRSIIGLVILRVDPSSSDSVRCTRDPAFVLCQHAQGLFSTVTAAAGAVI